VNAHPARLVGVVSGAAIAAVVAFGVKLAVPSLDPALVAALGAAVYSVLWVVIGEHTETLARSASARVVPGTRLGRGWKVLSSALALAGVVAAGVIVAWSVSSPGHLRVPLRRATTTNVVRLAKTVLQRQVVVLPATTVTRPVPPLTVVRRQPIVIERQAPPITVTKLQATTAASVPASTTVTTPSAATTALPATTPAAITTTTP
jgi:hypothetical protein